MAEPIEINASENTNKKVCSYGEHHNVVLSAINTYFINGKHCDVTLEAGIDNKR